MKLWMVFCSLLVYSFLISADNLIWIYKRKNLRQVSRKKSEREFYYGSKTRKIFSQMGNDSPYNELHPENASIPLVCYFYCFCFLYLFYIQIVSTLLGSVIAEHLELIGNAESNCARRFLSHLLRMIIVCCISLLVIYL